MWKNVWAHLIDWTNSIQRETFIFLGIFCNISVQSVLNFQSRVGWLFCENNQQWPTTKHCFDNFDSTLRASILKNICKQLLLKMCSWNWEKRLFIRNFYIYIKETSENVCFYFMKETSENACFYFMIGFLWSLHPDTIFLWCQAFPWINQQEGNK